VDGRRLATIFDLLGPFDIFLHGLDFTYVDAVDLSPNSNSSMLILASPSTSNLRNMATSSSFDATWPFAFKNRFMLF